MLLFFINIVMYLQYLILLYNFVLVIAIFYKLIYHYSALSYFCDTHDKAII